MSPLWRQVLKMIRYYITIFLLFVSALTVYPQQTYRLTVDELFEKGLENSITIQASSLRTQIAGDKLSIAKNNRLPDIGVNGSFGYVGNPRIYDRDLSYLKQSHNPDWKQNYQVSVAQPLYEGGRIKNNIIKAKLEQEIAQLSFQKDKADLKLWLIGKYLDLFNLYKQRRVYAQNIEEAKTRQRDIENMKAQGMITNNDVLRSKLVITNYELAYKTTNNDIGIISQQLTIVLGMDESLLLEPDSVFLSTQLNIRTETYYVQQAYNEYPDMKIAYKNISLAENGLKLAKSDLVPKLSVQASNTLARPIPNTTPVQDLYVNSWGVALNLSYNISSWFDKKHNVGAARRQVSLQQLMLEDQKQTIRTEVRAAFIKHSEALDRIKAMEESLIQANENYRIVKNKYFSQLSILTDLLDANTVQLNAELQLINAKTNAIYTYYQLQKVSGNL